MGNRRRDGVKEDYWRGVVERQSSSGLSARQFCRNERLAENSFYAWRRTIARRDGKQRSTEVEPTFVPAMVEDLALDDSPIVVELAGGLTLKLPSSLPMAQVAELVQALAGGVV